VVVVLNYSIVRYLYHIEVGWVLTIRIRVQVVSKKLYHHLRTTFHNQAEDLSTHSLQNFLYLPLSCTEDTLSARGILFGSCMWLCVGLYFFLCVTVRDEKDGKALLCVRLG
jgi:hypothetical protein